jgi:hypothetical protein
MINISTAKILLHLFLLSLLHQITTASLTDQELDFALSSLRSYGYTLFPNAISTSDLCLQLLNQSSNATSTSTFTLFCPPDSLLYSVDLASTAPHYTKSLFLHVSPSRLSTSDLRNLMIHPLHIMDRGSCCMLHERECEGEGERGTCCRKWAVSNALILSYCFVNSICYFRYAM